MENIYNNFNTNNIPPYTAKSILVKNESDEIVGKISLSDFKPEYGERLYRFGVMSDIHFNEPDTEIGENGIPHNEDALKDFNRALKFLNDKESVSFTCTCGDITSQDGGDKIIDDLVKYQECISTNSIETPVYTCTGNHDTNDVYDFDDVNYTHTDIDGNTISNLNAWKKYTGMTDRNYHFQKTINGITDNFYFLSMRKFNLGTQGTPFNDSDIDDLRNYLEEHKNERTFIFMHTPFPMRAGLFGYKYNKGNYWLGGKYLKALTDLSYKYKNTIWFSGHSHYEWGAQGIEKPTMTDSSDKQVYNFKEHNYDANIWPANQDHNRECGWAVHLPSATGVRPVDYAFGKSDWKVFNTSEFAIIDVYENYIDVRGISLFGENLENEGQLLYNPISQYRLDTSIKPENSPYYELTNLSKSDLDNMEIGSSKTIAMTSISYNGFHIGCSETEIKNTYIYNSFAASNGKYNTQESSYYTGNSVNCDLSNIQENDEMYKKHLNNEYQLQSEMRDLVNMRPNQFTFNLNKDEDGFYITNKSGKYLYVNYDGSIILSDSQFTYFEISSNNTDYISTSSLVSQTNNNNLLRLKIKNTENYFIKVDSNLEQYEGNSGWSLLYIYNVKHGETTSNNYECSVTIDSNPNNNYDQFSEYIDANEIVSKIGLSSTSELQSLIEAGNNVYIHTSEGLSNNCTGGANEFWLNSNSQITNWGNDSLWFTGISYEDNNIKIHVGQYPNAFDNITNTQTLNTTLSIINGDKFVVFNVTYNVNPESSNNEYYVTIDSNPNNNYDQFSEYIDANEIVSKIGLSSTSELQSLIEAGNNVYIHTSEGLSNSYTGGTNEFWLNSNSQITNWGNDSLWFAGVSYEDNNIRIHVGQYPNAFDNITNTQTLNATLSIINGDTSVIFNVTYNVNP